MGSFAMAFGLSVFKYLRDHSWAFSEILHEVEEAGNVE